MGKIGYYIALPAIYLLALLPFPLLYLFSDFLYLLLYRVAGYRKKVVLQNLRRSFPEKSGAEIKQICNRFYHHLCDMFLESFKMLTASRSTMLRRCSIRPEALALLNSFADKNQSIVLAASHLGNWEWAFCTTLSIASRQQLYPVYKPLQNQDFNRLVVRMRQRFGAILIPMRDTYNTIAEKKDTTSIILLAADQAANPQKGYWNTFLHQDTATFTGIENLARQHNYPVVYMSVRKMKRGYYELDIQLLAADPSITTPGQILEAYTRHLEKDIIAQPHTWLWSHKRWKHTRPQEAPNGSA